MVNYKLKISYEQHNSKHSLYRNICDFIDGAKLSKHFMKEYLLEQDEDNRCTDEFPILEAPDDPILNISFYCLRLTIKGHLNSLLT